jgi:hypothetical protein
MRPRQNQRQTGTTGVGDAARLPGQLLGPITQETVVGKFLPDMVDDGIGHAQVLQPFPRCGACLGNPFRRVQLVFQAAPQHEPGGGVEVGHETVAPRVPQLRTCAGDVGHGQQVEIIETLALRHHAGELRHHLRIGNILALRRDRHGQVLSHQPDDEIGVAGREPVAFAEIARVHRADDGMVAAAALRDVVEQPRQQQQFRLAQLTPQLEAERKTLGRFGPREAGDVAQHRQRVFVDGVHVEQVVLHAPGDAAEGRQIATKHTQARHAFERRHRLRIAQQDHEGGAHAWIGAEYLVDARKRFPERARRRRVQAAQIRMLLPDPEQLQDRQRPAMQQVGVAQRQAVVDSDEIVVDRHHVLGFAQAFVEPLQQALAETLHQRGAAKKSLHQLLDREIVAVFVVQADACGQRFLVVEQQTLLAPLRHQMQAVTQARQRTAAGVEDVVFVRTQGAERDEFIHARDAEDPLGQPCQRVQVAQAAGAFLEVRFEVVGGVVVAGVARVPLAALGHEELSRRPQVRRTHCRQQLRHRAGVPGQRTSLDQRRGDGDILARRDGALRDAAHRVPGCEPDIPQQCEEDFDRTLLRLLHGILGQYEKVDVGTREQLAAPIAAGSDQGQAGRGVEGLVPRADDDAVHRLGAACEKRIDVLVAVECGGEFALVVLQGLAGAAQPGRCVARDGGFRRRPGLGRRRRVHGLLSSPGRRVSTSKPSSVTAMVCSHCAESERSLVTTVQPSGSRRVWRAPALIIGSTVNTMPFSSFTPLRGLP